MITTQFIRFLVAGGIAAAANFGSRFVFSIFFAYGVAVFFAFLVGMMTAFILMRRHVFNARQGPFTLQAIKFAGVNVLAVLQTLPISLLMARYVLPSVGIVEQAEALGHLIGVLVPLGTSYFGHKFLTFR